LPWEKIVIDGDGLVSYVRCTICSKVEGRKKLLIPKFDKAFREEENYFCYA
jgi:hypothetical protein